MNARRRSPDGVVRDFDAQQAIGRSDASLSPLTIFN